MVWEHGVLAAIIAHRKAVSKILGEKKIFCANLTRNEKIRKISMIKHEDGISQDDKRNERFTWSLRKEVWMCR